MYVEPSLRSLSCMGRSTHAGARGSNETAGARSRSNMELVELALAGGEAGQLAWDELVRLHSRAVWKVAWSFRLTAADREDVYQSTWIRALERLSQVREPDRLHAWLMTIARNEALAVVRTRERLVPVEQTPAGVAHPVDAEAVERDERYRIAAAALAKLGPRCRELVRLLTAGLSYGEIENVMGWAPGGTAIRRARCLEALRRSPEVRRYLRALSDQAGSED